MMKLKRLFVTLICILVALFTAAGLVYADDTESPLETEAPSIDVEELSENEEIKEISVVNELNAIPGPDEELPESKPDVQSVSIDKTEAVLPANETIQLKAQAFPEDADQSFIWESSKKSVAAVDENGLVKALRCGNTVISAKSATGEKTAECAIKVIFSDVKGSPVKSSPDYEYWYTPVYWALDNNITNGYDRVYFGPEENCTRGQFMVFLWRLAGKPEVSTTNISFTDAAEIRALGTTFTKAVIWGYKSGIVNGFSEGGGKYRFGVNDTIDRKSAIIMLYRYAGRVYPGKNTKLPFSDISSYKKSSDTYCGIRWAYNYGIAKGYSEGKYAGKFGVSLKCLRKDMITFLYRFNGKSFESSFTGWDGDIYYKNGQRAEPPKVVVIDPGHDGRHGGAYVYSVQEEIVNMKIAQAVKAELETYQDVKVFLTHDTLDCPYSSNVDCLQARSDLAMEKGADIFVSVHNDVCGYSGPTGHLILCQNKSWKPELNKEGRACAVKISAELEKLGLQQRGIRAVDIDDGRTYPDGSVADYYAVLRHCKENGVAGIIVEHTVMDNSEESQKYLQSDEMLKKLGQADALGIANYLGLKK